jgi:hypothetical protein
MAFGDDDLRAMESDFGQTLTFRGVPVGVGTIDTTLGSSPDGVGMDVQRKVTVLRVRAGVLSGWERDDEVMCGGTRYRIREKLDDARTIDGAWDLFSVGVG